MRRRIIGPVFVALTLLLAVGFALAPNASFAQYSTPSMGQGTHQHPAHIHSGTCDTLGDVVYPLNDLTAPGMTGTPIAGMDSTPMAGAGEVVAQSTTTVDAPLDDILADDHAINVHLSAEQIDVYIACGDITGTADGGHLMIDLHELNNSGYVGRARLTDNGDDTTTVDVVLMQREGGMMATPAASPTS
jgi:hypothetical protein